MQRVCRLHSVISFSPLFIPSLLSKRYATTTNNQRGKMEDKKDEKENISLAMVGDVMLGRLVNEVMQHAFKDDEHYAFARK